MRRKARNGSATAFAPPIVAHANSSVTSVTEHSGSRRNSRSESRNGMASSDWLTTYSLDVIPKPGRPCSVRWIATVRWTGAARASRSLPRSTSSADSRSSGSARLRSSDSAISWASPSCPVTPNTACPATTRSFFDHCRAGGSPSSEGMVPGPLAASTKLSVHRIPTMSDTTANS